MNDPRRERAALTAGVERRLLVAMAERLPASIHSDHMTILGVLGAVLAAVGYGLSLLGPHWLWLASFALVLNWLGDSLDGTVARVRRAERPRYGYYLDHGVDAFTTLAIGVGLGMSPYLSLAPALLLVILYLLMSINVYLTTVTSGVFRMDYGWAGPTEVRILLILANTLLIGAAAWADLAPSRIEPVATLVVWGIVAIMAVMLLGRFGSTLRHLARLEPRGGTGAGAQPAAPPAASPAGGAGTP
jgi:archaetidylinositol phosphate synthase